MRTTPARKPPPPGRPSSTPHYRHGRIVLYAIIASTRERVGKPIAGFDALIAAVCRSRGAALATRNLADFDGTGIDVIDPWAAADA